MEQSNISNTIWQFPSQQMYPKQYLWNGTFHFMNQKREIHNQIYSYTLATVAETGISYSLHIKKKKRRTRIYWFSNS